LAFRIGSRFELSPRLNELNRVDKPAERFCPTIAGRIRDACEKARLAVADTPSDTSAQGACEGVSLGNAGRDTTHEDAYRASAPRVRRSACRGSHAAKLAQFWNKKPEVGTRNHVFVHLDARFLPFFVHS
jgi:hypothetical protein